MTTKSEVVVLDVLHKNEAKHSDMLQIMKAQQSYLGPEFKSTVFSGGDQLTCECHIILSLMLYAGCVEVFI